MDNNEKELSRFVHDPKYREKVINKIHKDEDNTYNKRIKQLEGERDRLYRSKTNEIKRITDSRWEKISGRQVMVNRTEGKIKINDANALFSSIKGAELNMIIGSRIETKERSKTISKKHVSVPGAVVGGVVAGPIGLAIGGAGLGKTTGKTKGTTTSNEIPTCSHLGVMVNLDGFNYEVVLLSSPVDQSSFTFSSAYKEAQNIITQLGILARTPVPYSFPSPEEEISVKRIEEQILDKEAQLQKAIAEKPTYAIPEIYRTYEQRQLSDEEYIQYLHNADVEREANEARIKQEQANRMAAIKAEKAEARELKRQQRADKIANFDYSGAAKNVGGIIYKIIFWVLSLFVLAFAAGSFIGNGIISGIVFLLTFIIVNPLTCSLIRAKTMNFPKWVPILVLIVGFLIGLILYPTSSSNTNINEQMQEEIIK